MYNLLEYSDNYSKISEISWQYFKNEPALKNRDEVVDFTVATDSFKMKEKINRSSRQKWHKKC